mmetsp:Transcript_35699/g.89804  ORF Transcript_35699/g.89804 Transcript_35699/m.89804 type:complete len:297 (+) Transcript_35699:455-1345(+)
MLGTQLLDGLDDLVVAAWRPHGCRGVVRVASGAVPITAHGLGVEGHVDAVHLANANHQVPRHPHVVPRLDALARADLVLPLAGHHLRVDARNLDARIEAGLVVGIRDRPADSAVEASPAIVWALRRRGPHLREAQGPDPIRLDQRVLLLDAEPRLQRQVLVEDGLGPRTGVCRDRRLCHWQDRLTKHQDVVALAEGVREDGDGLQQHLTVAARRLPRGGAVVVPDAQLRRVRGLRVQGHGLGADVKAARGPRGTQPHVLRHHFALLGQVRQQGLRHLALGRRRGRCRLQAEKTLPI